MGVRKSRLPFYLLLFCFVIFHQQAWSAPRAVATVLAASGALNVQRNGQKQFVSLPVRAALQRGDIVSTGANGRANLLFSDGSRVKMRENSRLEITAPDVPKQGTSLFRALIGGIWSRLRPGRGATTVFTNLVVRGTEFYIDVTADGTATLTVLEGTVDFSNKFGAVAVNAAQQSMAQPGKAPTVPVTIAAPGLIVEWTQDIDFAAVPREKFWTTRDAAFALRTANQMRAANGNALQMGEALFDAGDAEGALAQFAAPDANAQLHRGYALLKLARLDEAETAFRAALNDGAMANAARVGLAWTMLERNKPQEARDFVAPVVQATPQGDGANSEARLALAVALMRAPQVEGQDNLQAAVDQLKAALNGAQNWRYQAHAWLSAAYLAQGKNEEAQREAETAAQMAPTSVLAQSQLAQVSFFNNQRAQGLRAAKRVVALDSESVSGQMALSQANLAAGRVDDAAEAAARAVALDSKSPQANYLLGIADAGRRDYRHAISSLRTSLELAPEFYPALNALARVYVRAGREKEAATLLAQYENRPQNGQILAARGEYYYNVGQYKKALADYRRALEQSPGSALTWANLARTAIDANQLSEAINAGQQAVKLAPDIGAYHSILGLAYDFSRMQTQAARSYRTALVLDSSDALALVQLGRLQKDGDPRTTERVAAVTAAQGFLFDPAISRELLRAGVDTDLTARGGNNNRGGSLVHRFQSDDARFNALTEVFNRKDNGDLPNADFQTTTISENATYQADNRTTVFVNYLHRSENIGLPGALSVAADDRDMLRFQQVMLAARWRMNERSHLWASLFSSNQRDTRFNPNGDLSFVLPIAEFGLNFPITQSFAKGSALTPELRFDYSLNRAGERRNLLSIGYARPRIGSTLRQNLLFANDPDPPVTGNFLAQQISPQPILYAQWDGQINQRLTFVGQLRRERQKRTIQTAGGLGEPFPLSFDTPAATVAPTRYLPSAVANYRVGQKTNLRFFANRSMTNISGSLLAPPGTLISTEDQALPRGFPDPARDGDLRNLQVDFERYFGSGGLLKVFAFRNDGRSLTYDFSRFANPSDANATGVLLPNAVTLDRLKRDGVGVRLEQQLRRGLFIQTGAAFNRSTAQAALFNNNSGQMEPLIFNGQTAPYNPKFAALLGLNYISTNGLKAGVTLNHSGTYFADTFDVTANSRPRIGSSTTVDLLLAREPSVHGEIFLKVLNVFDKKIFVFNDTPLIGRRIIIGVERRF